MVNKNPLHTLFDSMEVSHSLPVDIYCYTVRAIEQSDFLMQQYQRKHVLPELVPTRMSYLVSHKSACWSYLHSIMFVKSSLAALAKLCMGQSFQLGRAQPTEAQL